MKKATERAPAQGFYYFAAADLGWGCGNTADEAIAKLARVVSAIDPGAVRRSLVDGGMYVWTCRVELPLSSRYSISSFQPDKTEDGFPVPVYERSEWALVTNNGTAIEITKTTRVANKGGHRQ